MGRADLLCALFMLSAFLVYCQVLDHSYNLLLSTALSVLTAILATLAMFSKEQGITILVSSLGKLSSQRPSVANVVDPLFYCCTLVMQLCMCQYDKAHCGLKIT